MRILYVYIVSLLFFSRPFSERLNEEPPTFPRFGVKNRPVLGLRTSIYFLFFNPSGDDWFVLEKRIRGLSCEEHGHRFHEIIIVHQFHNVINVWIDTIWNHMKAFVPKSRGSEPLTH